MDLLDILRVLVGFDTTSSRPNIKIVDWIEHYLSPLGFRCTRVSGGDDAKANLIASIGPQARPGFILSGHTDVVPVTGQAWSSDPFVLRVENGRVYGRGTCDMKGFLAVCLAAAPEMARADLARPIHLAFSYDEEVGCLGAKVLTAWIRDHLGPQEACFVGEPTGMGVVIGHKGNRTLKVRVTGQAAHSSLAPRHVNAIDVAVRLISKIGQVSDALRQWGPHDPDFDVPHCTTSVGTIAGGSATNIVAQECSFDVEFRTLPALDPERIIADVKHYAASVLEPEMRRLSPQAGIMFEDLIDYPGLDTAPDEPVTVMAKRHARRNGHSKVAYGTEAALFQIVARTPTVVVGPGSIEQAHQPDEYVTLDQLEACTDFIRRVIGDATQPVARTTSGLGELNAAIAAGPRCLRPAHGVCRTGADARRGARPILVQPVGTQVGAG